MSGGAISTIAGRDLAALTRSPAGWIVAALVLLVDALGFHGIALGLGLRPSSLVLEDLFVISGATTAIAALLLASRAIADERAGGRLSLYLGAPVDERDVIAGKAIACVLFVLAVDLALAPEIALLAWRGEIAIGHVLAGGAGLVLVAISATAIGIACSSVAPSPAIAALLGAATLAALTLAGPLSRVTSPPFGDLLGALAYHHGHFEPFARGLVRLSDAVFHVGVTYFALCVATWGLRRERSR